MHFFSLPEVKTGVKAHEGGVKMVLLDTTHIAGLAQI